MSQPASLFLAQVFDEPGDCAIQGHLEADFVLVGAVAGNRVRPFHQPVGFAAKYDSVGEGYGGDVNLLAQAAVVDAFLARFKRLAGGNRRDVIGKCGNGEKQANQRDKVFHNGCRDKPIAPRKQAGKNFLPRRDTKSTKEE